MLCLRKSGTGTQEAQEAQKEIKTSCASCASCVPFASCAPVPVLLAKVVEAAMIKLFRYRKIWPLQLVLAGLIVWLAHGILAEGQVDRKPVVIERPPLRFIKDPNPSFSAVAVDSDSNMLVVSDENMFRIMEYDRRESTPPRARLTE